MKFITHQIFQWSISAIIFRKEIPRQFYQIHFLPQVYPLLISFLFTKYQLFLIDSCKGEYSVYSISTIYTKREYSINYTSNQVTRPIFGLHFLEISKSQFSSRKKLLFSILFIRQINYADRFFQWFRRMEILWNGWNSSKLGLC